MIIHHKNYRIHPLGPKARNLFRLMENGYLVPPFFCVQKSFQEAEVLDYLAAHFPDTALFSVRSVASIEDGARQSCAGQFQTFLRVPKEMVCTRIKEVFLDGKRVKDLPEHSSAHPVRMQVMIQAMIESDTSGVLFTANPQGILNESVIVLGNGTGDQVVEDRTDTTTYYYHLSDQIYYYEQVGDAPLLSEVQIKELVTASEQIKQLFHMECDLEFAYQDGKLWFLQVRPITTICPKDPMIILDNSNIVESYPGITLPLTQSFIRSAYYQVFKNLLLHLTGEPKTVQQYDSLLKHMVDMVNGRVYYRISNWYDVLLLLPFHQKIIPVWQEMMGVRDRTISSCPHIRIRWTTRLKVMISFFRLLFTCPFQMRSLDHYFTKITRHFDSLPVDTDDNRILLSYYRSLQKMTVRRWDITLVNDMYAFLFTGLLKAHLKSKKIPDYDQLANQSISGIHQLESLKPVQKLQKLARYTRSKSRRAALLEIHTHQDYARYRAKTQDAFTRQLDTYIKTYGDRTIEELKLESKTFRTDPVLLIQHLLQISEGPPDAQSCRQENRTNVLSDLTGISALLGRQAALGIRNREKSRLHRSRLYGMMRTLVLQMGKNLQTQGRIFQKEDIFWLYTSDIVQAAKDPAMNLKKIIERRKEQYQGFYQLPAYSRLVFSGKIKHKNPRRIDSKAYDSRARIYTGTACSSGTATGKVLLVDHPSLQLDVKDKILVTKMTDPGWVFLIAQARAVVSEKGSLLSHTAIISRELGKPSIVGISHITERLKDNDLVQVDGDSGTLTILQTVPRQGEKQL